MGKSGNCIGGFTFQFSDGWWKFAQTKNLDIHDANASWSNGGYGFDFIKGKNNMNEEWFGVCAKGPANAKGLYQLMPRTAYYTLKEVHQESLHHHTKIILSELNSEQVKKELQDSRLLFAIGKGNVTDTFEKALERASQIMNEK